MITLAEYLKCGITDEQLSNSQGTVDKARLLLALYVKENGGNVDDFKITSGLRTPEKNASTPNASPNSKHLQGLAIDIYDPDGDLDEWCLKCLVHLEQIGLWLEHPSSTKGWCHLQTIPPKSGKRVFYP
jgi:hypothetical protein